ncbi:uncharacterized protein L969DRAFT_95072 [Mixia osmundae IAM 14324]|uniref:Hydrophobin n=1 Tax=Mixia osmundae (strain CBS 9802 / IAM 14324 / JCM 22182 / KY 12970) TaxID=764103 RepID=G7E7D9_MIXOS|nr:uncharacterized protein L969DRAFT_95072 [Mixia osmundae IAM 14324]KEI38909.1 hypothetical protein L969DRAFT_95072 [Mixia osmundae IAM 14324]GAA98749.1 hypothetical protein E5Q_05437 [Mixia osmundae IAM 14324]
MKYSFTAMIALFVAVAIAAPAPQIIGGSGSVGSVSGFSSVDGLPPVGGSVTGGTLNGLPTPPVGVFV